MTQQSLPKQEPVGENVQANRIAHLPTSFARWEAIKHLLTQAREELERVKK